MTVTTLGTLSEVQKLDGLDDEQFKRYMHQYNFPPYCTGEAKPLRSAGRREIGHGALAERALEPVLPSEKDFPYAIRTVSEVLSSNGSSSMGSVCGSTLSLMDAGVPIKSPVAGIAMGLILEGDRHVILSDIQGLEDFLGDMDFKVAGTANGITAIQMDIKITGISAQMMKEALEQAHVARMSIMQNMLSVLDAPRPELKPHAPRIITVKIPIDKIGALIGPGGKNIRSLQEETGTQIDNSGCAISLDWAISLSGAISFRLLSTLPPRPAPRRRNGCSAAPEARSRRQSTTPQIPAPPRPDSRRCVSAIP
jgi:polyribonucleotide nucleotidyltransferase